MPEQQSPHPLEARPLAAWMKDELDRAVHARGFCVGGFSQVEFILADFVMKAGKLAPYQAFGASHPHRFESRVERVRQIAQAVGPVAPYAERLREVCDEIERWYDLRHFLVHGWMQALVNSDQQAMALQMRLFRPEKVDPWATTQIEMGVDQLVMFGDAISDLASHALKLFHDIYANLKLEEAVQPHS